jgi:gamma-glutamyltranspeptidase/glutathione hydrolase
MYSRLCSFILTFFIFSILSCNAVHVEKLYSNGTVASSSAIASNVGVDILKRGGNAVDAAVATAFALAVTHPSAGNIGGGGFALYYRGKQNEIKALDFRETAPSAATRDMYLDADGEIIENASLIGAKAAGVPGTVAGLFALWKKYGTKEWRELLEPAVMLADTGFIVDNYLAGKFSEYRQDLLRFDETAAIFAPGGHVPAAGARLIQKDLSATLNLIALDTTDGFYAGKTADLIVAAMQKHGGLISHDDLKGYAPVWRDPIHFRFDSLDVFSMPPPSSGGVVIGMILGLLEPYEFSTYTSKSPELIHLFAEACRLSYVERAEHLGDPAVVDNPVRQMLDPDFLAARRKLIDPDHCGISSEIGSGIAEMTGKSESTTHFCVADNNGDIVSITYTINTSFGSKLVVAGAGFLLNNEMDDFSAKPGVPNVYGLIGNEANAIAPGTRMLSSMSPTSFLKNGRPCLALGSPGGSKIITAVAEAVMNFSRFDLRPEELVQHPRYHHQWMPDALYLEKGKFDINIVQDLISRGHNVKEIDPFCELELIYFNDAGQMIGAADPRGGGKAVGY